MFHFKINCKKEKKNSGVVGGRGDDQGEAVEERKRGLRESFSPSLASSASPGLGTSLMLCVINSFLVRTQ